jgi:phosphomannomutase/phosphoglucomutase
MAEQKLGSRPKFFGTNGVRGVINVDYYPDFFLHIAMAFGTIIKDKDIVIGSDGRSSLHTVKGAVTSGLTATGHDVIDIGLLPVPALQYYCKTHGLYGVMITASHNPPEYNGVKFIDKNGSEVEENFQNLVERGYLSSAYIASSKEKTPSGSRIGYAKWDGMGTVNEDRSAKAAYINGIMKGVDCESIRKAGLRVLCDCVNGATSETTPMLLRALGVKEITLNSNIDWRFPAHNSEPVMGNIKDTMEMTKKAGVDLAVAHDSDGDRAVFVSPEGRYLDGNYSLAVASLNKVRRGDTVVTPISTSDIVEIVVGRVGGKLIKTRTGAPVVIHEMVRRKAKLGGEENGGTIFGPHQYCRDGAMTLALWLEAIAKDDLGTILKRLPDLHYRRDRVETKADFNKIKAALEGKRNSGIDYSDGMKLQLGRKSWIMVRPSGTEPVIRLYAQAESEESLDRILKEYKNAIEKLG